MKDPQDCTYPQEALCLHDCKQECQKRSGWRKRQIAHMDVHSHPAEFVHLHRNDTLEEVAVELERRFTGPFGRDTVASFAAYIRGMKR